MCIEDRLLKELLQESVNKCYREESEEDDKEYEGLETTLSGESQRPFDFLFNFF